MKKRILILLGSLLLLFLIFRIVTLIIGKGGGTQSQNRPPVAVEVDSVRFGSIREIRQFTGSVIPYYQYIVAPKVSGRIISINKRIGDWVRRGEIVGKIDDAEYEQAVLEAEANLKIAQASLAETQSQFGLAKQDLDRVQSLQSKGIASPSELDAAMTNYDAQQSRLKLAQAQVEQREASLRSAKIRLNYTVLVASEPGYVGERYTDEGSLLTPNAPVISILGIEKVIIRTTIIERDYGRIRVDQEAEVGVDAYTSKRFQGRVARIAPMLQQASRMAQMEIEVVNDSLILKPGMFARVDVVLSEKENVQIVPNQAVVNREGVRGCFTVDLEKKTAVFIPVETGIVASDITEIVSPSMHGLVVTLGHHLLANGSPVILPEPGGTKGSETNRTGGKEQNR